MPNLLKAIGRAVAKFTGPLGFPLDFLLSLYEDERSEEREQLLKDAFSSLESVQDTQLLEIASVKQDVTALTEQVHSALKILICGLRAETGVRHELHASLSAGTTEDLELALGQALTEPALRDGGVLTEAALVDELNRLFNEPAHFLSYVVSHGYDNGSWSHGASRRANYLQFVIDLRGFERQPCVIARYLKSLSGAKPGSHVLSQWVAFYAELCRLSRTKRTSPEGME